MILALGRICIKFNRFNRFFVDDAFFILATVLLVAGTVTVFLVLPYNQTEVNVGAGVEAPPADLTHQLDLDVKLQDLSSVFLNGCVFSVKFSFLFFFRLLLQHSGRLQIWWWCTFIFTIPCAVICMCTEFMVCPAFGDRIMSAYFTPANILSHWTDHRLLPTEICVSDTALRRQMAALYVVVVLDIFTDILGGLANKSIRCFVEH